MKYIKKFESDKNDDNYWLVPTDNRLQKSLEDIGVPIEEFETFTDNHNIVKNNYIFIVHYEQRGKMRWGWNKYVGNIRDSYFEQKKCKFKGLVNMDESELDAIKYNL